MSKFKVGDKLIAVYDDSMRSESFQKGDLLTVRELASDSGEYLVIEGVPGNRGAYNFKLAYTPHKRADLIKAWADGVPCEVKSKHADDWSLMDFRSMYSWDDHVEYRIKTEKSEDRLEIEAIEKEMRDLADRVKQLKLGDNV